MTTRRESELARGFGFVRDSVFFKVNGFTQAPVVGLQPLFRCQLAKQRADTNKPEKTIRSCLLHSSPSRYSFLASVLKTTSKRGFEIPKLMFGCK
mmetsp:Transcript_6080/g.25631  ORF Transcript_6080/g.25631 Transcript_6080/m.25631 type:complete len:95 (-) Transcript_6080:990-1274(-)